MKIVFDHFHVIKLFNDKLSDLWCALYREATEVMHKQVLKGTQWLLLKNPKNFDEEKDEKRRLNEALTLNQPRATAYYVKEDLRRFWQQSGKRFATTFLDGWIRRAEASGIKILQQMAKTLAAQWSGRRSEAFEAAEGELSAGKKLASASEGASNSPPATTRIGQSVAQTPTANQERPLEEA
jgi:transposase